jgi:glycosyltransferase involved in cell wall biosynthesis
VKKRKLAFICQKGLETFIEPIVQQFEKLEQYQVHRYYCNTQPEIIAAVKWCDVCWIEWANEIAIFATQIYDLRKKGVIVRLHSYESLSPMPQQIDWSVVDYLVFVAPHIREIVKTKIPDLDKRVCTKIVPNGVDIDRIELNKELNPLNIAYVCNINHKKEPALALQIMAELVKQDKEYKLHVAGAWQDERYKIYMKYMAKEMGIEDNIIYYGFVQDMDTFWQGKGIILSTSIHEGHPYNIMEGASRGLRPVVHNFMGSRELYPASWLFNTVNEAVNLVLLNKCTDYYDNIRKYIIDRGWTLDNQIKQFKELVDKAGRKGK